MSRTIYIESEFEDDARFPTTHIESDEFETVEEEAADVALLNAMIQATQKGKSPKKKKASKGDGWPVVYGYSFTKHTEEETRELLEECLQAPKPVY